MKEEHRASASLCIYCTSPGGALKPRETVREGLIHVFMRAERIERPKAEKLVDAHLAKMPAWNGSARSAKAEKPAARAAKPAKRAASKRAPARAAKATKSRSAKRASAVAKKRKGGR